jgi:hypothetical protein
MSFPNLVMRPGGVQWCEATGVPTNGVNTILLDFGVPLAVIDPSWVDVAVQAMGPSVTGATVVSIVGNVLTMNFVQSGADACKVVAHLEHTLGR